MPFLEDFGKPVRESACECERSSGMVLGPILKLINGPTVADALDRRRERAESAGRERKGRREADRRNLRAVSGPQAHRQRVEARRGGAARPRPEDHAKAVAALAEYEKQLPGKASRLGSVARQAGRLAAARSDGNEVRRRRDVHASKTTSRSSSAATLAKDVYTIVAPLPI